MQQMEANDRVQLGGVERLMSLRHGIYTRIAHVMLLEGSISILENQLAESFMKTCNRHPRMRARVDANSPLEAIISPYFTIELASKLVTIQEVQSEDCWQTIVKEKTQPMNMDRTRDFPFELLLLKQDLMKAALILFSDHTFSDGFSGMLILNDIVECAFNPQKVFEPEPLLPSLYNLRSNRRGSFSKIATSAFKTIGLPIMKSDLQKFKPFLPIDKSMQTFSMTSIPYNESFAFFKSGTKENLANMLRAYKSNRVTLNSSIESAILIAALKTFRDAGNKTDRKFKFSLDVDYNMRKRIEPNAENNVGFFIEFATLETFKSSGISDKDLFWKLAERCQQETRKSMSSILNKFTETLIHEVLNAETTKQIIELENGCTSDIYLSNLLSYPFQREFGQTEKLRLTNFFLYNNQPHIGPATLLLISSVDTMNYSMMSKLAEPYRLQFFNNLVRTIESIGLIGPHDTVEQTINLIFNKSESN